MLQFIGSNLTNSRAKESPADWSESICLAANLPQMRPVVLETEVAEARHGCATPQKSGLQAGLRSCMTWPVALNSRFANLSHDDGRRATLQL